MVILHQSSVKSLLLAMTKLPDFCIFENNVNIMIMAFVSTNMVSVCITIVIRSVVVEEGVVTADGLAVDWVSLL